MARFRCLVSFLLVLTASAWAQTKQESIQAVLQKFIDAKRIVGASVAILPEEGNFVAAAAGFQDREEAVLATPETIYRLGSISKPVTAVAALVLVQKGKIPLDSDVSKIVSEWPDRHESMTLRHLLTHTSGVRHYTPPKRDIFYEPFTVEESLGVFKDDDLLFKPGEKVSYSTHAFSLVARIVEVASGETFESYIKAHVSKPSAAQSLGLEDRAVPSPHRSNLYEQAGLGTPKMVLKVENISWKSGGGGMEASAVDLARFGSAVMAQKLVDRPTTEMMFKPQSFGGLETGRGLGWVLGGLGPEHGGAQQGCRSLLVLDTKSRTAIVIMTNTGGNYDLKSLLDEIHRIWNSPE